MPIPDVVASTDPAAAASENDAAISAALAALPASGGVIDLGAGRLKISQKIVLGTATSSQKSGLNNVILLGHGGGTSNAVMPGAVSGGTELVWEGEPGGTMLEINGPVSGVRVEGIVFNCNGIASTGIQSIRSFNQVLRDVMITRWADGFALRIGADRVFTGGADGGAAPEQHLYEGVYITDPQGDQAAAHCAEIGTNVIGAVATNQLSFHRCQFERGTNDQSIGLWLGNCDHLSFISCLIHRRGPTGTTGKAIVVAPRIGAPNRPSNIVFVATPTLGGIWVDDTETPWVDNYNHGLVFYPFYSADSQTVPPNGALGTTLPPGLVGGVTDRGHKLGERFNASTLEPSSEISNVTAVTFFDRTITLPQLPIIQPVLVRVRASGRYSSSGGPAISLSLHWGSAALCSAVIVAPNALDYSWHGEACFVVRSTGSTGQAVRHGGYLALGSFNYLSWEPSADARGTFTISTGGTAEIKAGVGFSVASPSNKATLDALTIEITPVRGN